MLTLNSLEVRHGHFLLIKKAGRGRGLAGAVGEEGRRDLRPAGRGRRGGAGWAGKEGGRPTPAGPGLGDVEQAQHSRSVFNHVGFCQSQWCSMNSEIRKLRRKVILLPRTAGLGWC